MRRHRWISWTAFVSTLVLIGQVPAGSVDVVGSSPSLGGISPKAPTSKTCTAVAPSDPPLWEQNLPTSKVPPGLLAKDPRCVQEAGRSATSVVWRNPDRTLTSNMYQSPVNYRAADGKWKGIDTRLDLAADGGLTNRAGPFGVHFARTASDATLVTLSRGGASIAFGFAGAAKTSSGLESPAPIASVVSGAGSDTVTYTGALANTDLRYQLLPHEVKEAIVLNKAQAADVTPQFEFPLHLTGLTAKVVDDGTISFVDATSGDVAFAIPAGMAADANGATTTVRTQLVPSADPSMVTLVVSIDPKWLSDASRAFPVTIDPSFTDTTSSDAYVNSNTTTANCNGSCQYNGTTYVDKAGTSSSITYRTFQQYPDLSSLSGTDILGASWNAYVYAHAGTTPLTVTLQPPSASWSASTVTWANQPAVRTNNTSVSYTGGTGWITDGITGFVQGWTDPAQGPWGQYGIRVAAATNGLVSWVAQEGAANQQSYLQITYDAYPTLTNFAADGQYSTTVSPNTQPFLSATISDADSASGLTGNFEVWNAAHTGSALYSGSDPTSVSSGSDTTWQVSTALTAGTTYSWRVRGSDGTATSAWSAWQTLTVDQTAPATPTISIAGLSLNSWNTSGGTSATATLGDSSTDVAGFEWGLDVGDSPTTFVKWDAGVPGATITINPTWGWHDLAVRAIDQAGNPSTTAAHFTFGWGQGGFTLPQPETTTQKNITARVYSTTSYTGISLQWRRADTDTWADIPVGGVTYASSGSGIGSWPVTATPGTNYTLFPDLVWNAASTAGGVDGPLQLRAGFYQSGTYTYLTDTPSIPHLHLDQAAFGGGTDAVAAGPGSVDLLTGNLELNAADVSVPGGNLSRTFQSRSATTTGDIFGPGWKSSVSGVPIFQSLADHTDSVVITGSDGGELDFGLTSNASYPYTYASAAGSTDLTLTKTSASAFSLSDVSGMSTTFTNTSGTDYRPATVTDVTNQTSTTSWTVAGGITEPTQITAPPPSGVNCTSTPLTTRGCETVTFDYAATTQSTSLCGSPLGDYAGQLRNVNYTAWDPDKSGGAGMNTVNVATYCYDTSGLLRAEWDPRISSALKTQYTYNTDGQVASLTPPGVNAWNFTYAPLSGEPTGTGRLSTVYRAELSPLGNATTTFVYRIPLTTAGGGAYNLDGTTTATWGQHDNPTDATAVFPPDQAPSGTPPSSYTRATVYYLDVNAQLVNVASPGGYITTGEYDNVGNTIRTLSAADRQEALNSGSNSAWHQALAAVFSATDSYDSAGINVSDSYGPAHRVRLPDGTERFARLHINYLYDQGSPGGLTHNLVTTEIESARALGDNADQDIRTTSYAYNIGGDTTGWTLGKALQTTVDPGTGSHLHLTMTKKYDATSGNLTARILPANTSGGDAHETDFVYFTAGTNSQDASCGNHPEWDGLPCDTKPAAQPGTTGLPNLPTAQVTAYNMYGQPESSVDTNGTDTRTSTLTYDVAGRPVTSHVTGTSAAGVALPTVTAAYDTGTGLPTTNTDGSLTITRGYDALGRLHTYQDADGNTSTYTYDLLDRLSTLNDGKNTATYTYNDVGSEQRGLPTTINYGASIGSFTATYNPDGQLLTQTYPGGLTATYTYDENSNTTALKYTNPGHGGGWPYENATYNSHDQVVENDTWGAPNSYSYDAAGRLAQDNQVAWLLCNVIHNNTWDADTNRTQDQIVAGCPGSQGTSNTNYTYDSADRGTNTGYTYDKFGRTTTVPSSDTGGNSDTLTYYANNLVDSIASGTQTVTHNLDPNERLRTFVSSAAPTVTHTNHYTGDGDSPAWTSEVTAGTTWTEWLQGFNGLAATVNQAGTVTNQCTDIHGDVIATLASTDYVPTDANETLTDAWGNVEYGGTNQRYDYLGTAERKRDVNSGLQLMGERVYNSYTGRFLQTDPVVGGSANGYDYVSGDPVNASDLSGTISSKFSTQVCSGNHRLHISVLGHTLVDESWSDHCYVIIRASATAAVALGMANGTVPKDNYGLAGWMCNAAGNPTIPHTSMSCQDALYNVKGNLAASVVGAALHNQCLVIRYDEYAIGKEYYLSYASYLLNPFVSNHDSWEHSVHNHSGLSGAPIGYACGK